MASWVDERLPQFKPYVQQLPIEAMVSVGVEKQRRYDEGYQRIQSTIDKVAGLSILRPNDKEYLQSKMNELGNNLRMVSMGDFSNYQLVNSVGGMVNQVGRDEKVQNAVISTARVREERGKLEAAQKTGKSSPNREYDFNKTLSEYLNDPKVGSSYSGEFREHIDVNKKVLDVIGKLHPNVKIQDIAYGYNKDGSINTQDILDAMHRQGITEVSENQIRTAVNAVLDENDYDELASAGRYHYRGLQPQDLGKIVEDDYIATRQRYQKRLEEIQKNLLMATNPSQILELQDDLKYYQNFLGDATSKGKLEENQISMREAVINNPDGVRANLYTRNYLDQISNGFSYREVKDEILTSPLREDYWKRQNYNLSLIKEQNEEAQRGISNKFRERELDQQLLIAGMKANKGKPTTENPFGNGWTTQGNPTTSDLQSLQNFNSTNSQIESDSRQILKDIAVKYSTPKTKLNENFSLIMIDKYKRGEYTPENPSIRAAFDKYIKNTVTLANNKEYKQTKEDVVSKKVLGGQTLAEKLNRDLSQVGDLVVDVPGEGATPFSSKEVYEFLAKERINQPTSAMSIPSFYIPLNELTPREKKLYSAMSKRYQTASRYEDSGKTNNPYIDNYTNKISALMNDTKDDYGKIQQLLAEEMADVTGAFGTQGKDVNFDKETDKGMFASNVANLVNKGVVADAFTYSPEGAMKLLKDDGKNTAFSVISKGDAYAIRLVDKNDKSNYQDIPVDASYITQNQYLGGEYVHENVNMAKQLLFGSGSTNPWKDYNHAHYTSGDFGKQDGKGRKTVTLPVAADLEGGIGDNTFYPTIKLRLKNGEFLPITGQNPQNIQDFENKYLPQLTDADIISMYKSAGYSNIEQLIK